MNFNPKVSIIIRTLNEAEFLPNLFHMIRKQSYKNHETIVVDSGSLDGTHEIAKKHSDVFLSIDKNDFTFGFAINYGIRHATGDLACIVSAHTKPTNEHWLSELVNAFESKSPQNGIAMSYGKQIGHEKSNFSEAMDFTRSFGDHEIYQSNSNYFCNNANAMIRKDLWESHPFNEQLTGLEDIEWSKYWMDKGFQVVYKPDACIEHIHHENGKQIRNRFWRESIAARSIGVLSVINIFSEIPRQLTLLLKDIYYFFMLSGKGHLSNIVTYRFNRLIGTLKSLTNKKFNLKGFRENYHSVAYEALEFEQSNTPVKKSLFLEPIKPNEVLIKVSYVGVCETDFEVLRGDLEYYKSGWAKYPIVPGHEYSGIVARVGSKVSNFKEGDRVVGRCILSCNTCEMCLSGRETACSERKEVGVLNYNGAYSEFVILPSRFVHKIPKDLSLIAASSIEPLAVVLKGMGRIGLDDQTLSDKESILVIGAGPIGHLSGRVAHHWGHRVTVVDKNQKRLDSLNDIPVHTQNEINDLSPYSYIIECTGDIQSAEKLIIKSAPATSILLLGLPYGNRSLNLENIVSLDKQIIGTVGSGGNHFENAIKLAPRLNLESFNKTVFDFDQWESAWEMHRTKNAIKVKIKIAP